MSVLKIRNEQSEWLIDHGFEHTADVLYAWNNKDYVPMCEPQDCIVTKVATNGMFRGGSS